MKNLFKVILIIFAFNIHAYSQLNDSFPQKGNVDISTGLGLSNGLYLGCRYLFYNSASIELTVGKGLIQETGSDKLIIIGTGLNYYIIDNTIVLSILGSYVNNYQSWANKTEYFYYLGPALGFEEFITDRVSLDLRVGLIRLISPNQKPKNEVYNLTLGLNYRIN